MITRQVPEQYMEGKDSPMIISRTRSLGASTAISTDI